MITPDETSVQIEARMHTFDNENRRREDWADYLNERGLSRGAIGHRVLEAYGAGYDRATVAMWLGVSPGYVSALASSARRHS